MFYAYADVAVGQVPAHAVADAAGMVALASRELGLKTMPAVQWLTEDVHLLRPKAGNHRRVAEISVLGWVEILEPDRMYLVMREDLLVDHRYYVASTVAHELKHLSQIQRGVNVADVSQRDRIEAEADGYGIAASARFGTRAPVIKTACLLGQEQPSPTPKSFVATLARIDQSFHDLIAVLDTYQGGSTQTWPASK